MDTNSVIPAFAAIFCGISLFRASRNPNRQSIQGWITIWGVMLVLAGISYFYIYEYAALISGVPFMIFVFIPLNGIDLARQLLSRRVYNLAYPLTQIVYWLHPLDNWKADVVIAKALYLGSREEFDTAIHVLEQYGHPEWPGIAYARLTVLSMNARWETLSVYFENELTANNQSYLMGYYLRALGETGNANKMLTLYAQNKDKFSPGYARYNNILFAYAFSGQPEQVERTLQNLFATEKSSWKKFWVATADFAAGATDKGEQEIREALALKEPDRQANLKRRLSYQLPCAKDILTPDSRVILANLEGDLIKAEDYFKQTHADRARAYVTYSLIAINCFVFLLETVMGGSEDPGTLIKMGALSPLFILLAGEWWRLLASMFLHLGLLHLALNMFALNLFGPFVERVLGFARYAIIYFLAGLGPGLLLVLLVQYQMIDPSVLIVGASGAIMGVLGAEAGIMLRAWRVNKSQVAQQRLTWIIFILALESVFDLALLSPISLLAHMSGAVIGFIVSLLLKHRASGTLLATGQ